jgi:hypothetical protein
MQRVWGEEKCEGGLGGGDLREKDHLEDLGIDGRIILSWIFKKLCREAWTGLIWLWGRERWRAK